MRKLKDELFFILIGFSILFFGLFFIILIGASATNLSSYLAKKDFRSVIVCIVMFFIGIVGLFYIDKFLDNFSKKFRK